MALHVDFGQCDRTASLQQVIQPPQPDRNLRPRSGGFLALVGNGSDALVGFPVCRNSQQSSSTHIGNSHLMNDHLTQICRPFLTLGIHAQLLKKDRVWFEAYHLASFPDPSSHQARYVCNMRPDVQGGFAVVKQTPYGLGKHKLINPLPPDGTTDHFARTHPEIETLGEADYLERTWAADTVFEAAKYLSRLENILRRTEVPPQP
jgi:hypothetical protein